MSTESGICGHELPVLDISHVSLFSGIGGFDLAAEWAGFTTILQVERDPYCLRVLDQHWPDVLRITDIREVTCGSVSRPITVISGGFPCQPFSAAGKRGGTADDRYLWPEMLRVIRELSPAWIVGENVPGLLSLNAGLEFETIVSQLEDTGYEVCPLYYPAAGVGAVHRRNRIFIVAHTSGDGVREQSEPFAGSSRSTVTGDNSTKGSVADTNRDRQQTRRLSVRSRRQGPSTALPPGQSETVADTAQQLLHRSGNARQGRRGEYPDIRWWTVEPGVGRVATGVSYRVDRLRGLGNAVVPEQAYPIFQAIAEVERMRKKETSNDAESIVTEGI